MTDEIDQKGIFQRFADAFIRQQELHIKKIARVLPIQRGAKLAGIKIIEIQHLDFGKTESLLYTEHHRAQAGRIYRTTQHRRHFYLDLAGAITDYQTSNGAAIGQGGDTDT